MGDVSIVINKDGHIIGVDGEDGDDSDVDAISGSGESSDVDYTTTPESTHVLTTTSKNSYERVGSSSEDTPDFLPYILAGVAGVVVLVLVIALVVCCRRRRRTSKSKKPNSGPVVYSPNGRGDCVGGEGYSIAIPLNMTEPPLEPAPPPPPGTSAPPLSASGGSTRYTPLGGGKDVVTAATPMLSEEEEKNSIYESIDDEMVANVYEEAKPALPKSNSDRRPRPLSSVGEDPNMGSEKDKMLPPSSPV